VRGTEWQAGRVPTEESPTLMRRRWWVTFAVALAAVVVVVWWLRQPEGDPAAEEEPDTGTASLSVPDEAGGWERDSSPEADEYVEGVLAAFPVEDAGTQDSLRGGTYLRADEADGVQSFVMVVLDPTPESELGTLVSGNPAEAAATIAGGTRAVDVVRYDAETDDDVETGLACGTLTVPIPEGAPAALAQQPLCVLAHGPSVAVLSFAESSYTLDEAADEARDVLAAAVA